MPIVKIHSNSKHGFVVNELRGFVIPAKGVDVDTETKMYDCIKPYITKGILRQAGETAEVKPQAALPKVEAPVKIDVPKVSDVSEVVAPTAKGKTKKNKGFDKYDDAPADTSPIEELAAEVVDAPVTTAETVKPSFDFS